MQEFQKLHGKGLLIHHWDTDGICSAKLIMEKLKDKIQTNITPTLGNYFLTEQELEEYSNYDFIIIADMSLPEQNINRLSKNAEVLIFDHHLGKVISDVFHHNPVIKGENPDDYPSASWIVNDYLQNPINLYGLLGIIGDHEQKIKNNVKFYEKITTFCNQNNITFEDMLKMVYLLDTNYKIGNKKFVEQAPHILLEYTSPLEILNNKEWNQNFIDLEEEIQNQLNKENDSIDDIIFKKMNSSYNIISTITRKLAWNTGKNTIVLNTGFFEKENQLYVRSVNKGMEPMIKRGKDLGFKCGGKKEVLGAIIPKNETDNFITEIFEFFNETK
jgi:single-stranded DNA-specific DHH superfamily exonuclease